MAELISATIGIVAGAAAMKLWQATETRFGGVDFWPTLRDIAGDLLRLQDQQQFLRRYGELLRLLAKYVGGITCRGAVAAAPVVLCLFVLGLFAAPRGADTFTQPPGHSPPGVTLTSAAPAYDARRATRVSEEHSAGPYFTAEELAFWVGAVGSSLGVAVLWKGRRT